MFLRLYFNELCINISKHKYINIQKCKYYKTVKKFRSKFFDFKKMVSLRYSRYWPNCFWFLLYVILAIYSVSFCQNYGKNFLYGVEKTEKILQKGKK